MSAYALPTEESMFLDVDNYISVVRIDGTHLFSGAVKAGQHIALEKGIYLVRTAKGTQKVVVK